MEKKVTKLLAQLSKCRRIINKGYTSAKSTGIIWLNTFCADFLQFSTSLHTFLGTELDKSLATGDNEQVDIVFLCLTQIVTCIKHMERTIKAEEAAGMAISASRQHFLDRIHFCLEQLRSSLQELAVNSCVKKHILLEKNTYVELMDLVLDQLAPYSSYSEGGADVTNVAEENAEAMFASRQIRSTVDLVLSHTLAFANVALKQDKKALSALCQKVLRECIAFQDECNLKKQQIKLNDSNRKLKAISLENALYQLEDYLNEALLRLVYTCFLDYGKFSIEKLRTVMRVCDPEDPALDELIADFDVNVDRTTQIGMFAIAFAPNMKMKTTVRSCLASLESLDACIIPSLYTKNSADIHSEILEQHFNEEVSAFRHAIQEIIDSHAFASCYHEMLTQIIAKVEKDYNKVQLQEILQMGEFLYEHFQLKVNYAELHRDADRQRLFEKFTLILRECQAILMCSDQVEPQRVLKRFKILRSILRKFIDSLNDNGEANVQKNNKRHDLLPTVFLMSDDEQPSADSQRLFESVGISSSIRSILYGPSSPKRRRRSNSDSMLGNYSQLVRASPLAKTPLPPQAAQATRAATEVVAAVSQDENSRTAEAFVVTDQRRCSVVRRKESLRTAMFKRQKSTESAKVYNHYKNNSASLQISEILDQLTGMSSNFSNASQNDKSIDLE